MAVPVAVHFITMPVEFDASSRALASAGAAPVAAMPSDALVARFAPGSNDRVAYGFADRVDVYRGI